MLQRPTLAPGGQVVAGALEAGAVHTGTRWLSPNKLI